jgi:hypothetical protein
MKIDKMLGYTLKSLTYIFGVILSSYISVQGLMGLLNFANRVFKNAHLPFGVQLILIKLLYFLFVLVYALFIFKSKSAIKIALHQIRDLPFFSPPILLLFVTSGLTAVLLFMTFILFW